MNNVSCTFQLHHAQRRANVSLTCDADHDLQAYSGGVLSAARALSKRSRFFACSSNAYRNIKAKVGRAIPARLRPYNRTLKMVESMWKDPFEVRSGGFQQRQRDEVVDVLVPGQDALVMTPRGGQSLLHFVDVHDSRSGHG